ncbi:TPA: hypothetical protein ACGADT_005455, partial [Salmonella enterica subsp. enterica serovar Newport]
MKNSISLQADKGGIIISGGKTKSQIKSETGNVNVKAYNPLGTKGVTGVLLSNTELNASEGDIYVTGTTPLGEKSGVRIINVNFIANTGSGHVDVDAESHGGQDTYDEKGSLYIGGENKFSASDIKLNGRNTRSGVSSGAGVVFDGGNSSFSGKTVLTGYGYGVGISFWDSVRLDFSNGSAFIKGKTTGPGPVKADGYYRTGAISGSALGNAKVTIHLDKSNLEMIADSSSSTSGAVPAFGIINPASGTRKNGFIFDGEGNVDISGISTDGNAVDARLFNNIKLNGDFNISGSSKTGVGVRLNDRLDVNLKDAVITG